MIINLEVSRGNFQDRYISARARHYENTPIQIYWKFYHQKTESFQIKILKFFHISPQNIDCGYSLEPPRRGGSDEYPQSMFLIRNKKNNVYPCKPQFYYIKVGFKGLKIIKACFRDGILCPAHKSHYKILISQLTYWRRYHANTYLWPLPWCMMN